MNFIETVIYTTTEGIEAVTGVLLNLGITGFVIEDPTDFENFLSSTEVYWDYVDESLMALKNKESNVKVYLPDNAQGRELLYNIRQVIGELLRSDLDQKYGRLEIELKNVKEEDWANNWKQFFKPFPVGSRFLVKPTWEEYRESTDRMILEIDPSSSFGTGTHDTTQLCMEALERYVQQDSQVLDMGCGSGILSICAFLSGCQHVTAVDIDENAVRIAKENMIHNKMESSTFDVYCGNLLTDTELFEKLAQHRYQIIVANIVADVILAMRPYFLQLLSEDGVLITSGIIGERADEVEAGLIASGFQLIARQQKNDWVSLCAKRADILDGGTYENTCNRQ